ncbi:MAG TPA: serine hydrolase domain-containing protein [Cyclobacteriaceae bacterium]|nr:serine hydrolase domain-containing protein [Cyclobacteriaceae bacterium]
MKNLATGLLFCASISFAAAQSSLPKKMDSLFQKYDSKTAPGVAVGIVMNEKVVFTKGYGLANMEYDIPITPASVFDIASVSKQFAGLAISTLVQEGKISLQDDIHKYLPDVPDFGKTITIDHLVHHTSGLRDWPEGLNVAGWRWDEAFTFSDIIRMVKHQKELDFEPGERYSYSNTGYNLLALIVEKVSGMSFRKWTDENIFKPLQMDHSRFQDDYSELTKNMAYSYHRDGDVYKKNMTGLTAVGSSSLFTNVDDLCKWVIHFSKRISAKDPVYLRMLEGNKFNNGEKNTYAFGLGPGDMDGLPIVAHTGGWAGYRTVIMNFPDEKLSIILLGNNGEFNPHGTAGDVARVILKGKMKSQPATTDKTKALPTIKLKESLATKFIGTYQLGDNWYVKLTLENRQIMTQANGEEKFPAIPKSDSVLWIDAYNSSMTFVTGKDGKVNMLRYRGFNAPKIVPVKPDQAQWKSIPGIYYSKEFGTEYEIESKDGKLIMHHMRLGDFDLTEDIVKAGSFSSGIGTMTFFGEAGKVEGFRLSRGRIRNIKFDKVDKR